jgi:hypothetical protein
MAEEATNGSGVGHDGAPIRIIPRHDTSTSLKKFWVVVGSHIKNFATQAEAETEAIRVARDYPGQTVRVTKTVKAFRVKEPPVETLESE